ncbi:oxidoreductase C-terminal domain-containing protein [Methylobacterium currus]|uniref:oxidoreductase C-terminal domain-containing protein n=1 Tax=Methylobacterium currus TaxID=2051553 RepID=UPI0022AB3C49|nr:oxidoreductase C-terminal domain-containing protein [Methylobacterium currus]
MDGARGVAARLTGRPTRRSHGSGAARATSSFRSRVTPPHDTAVARQDPGSGYAVDCHRDGCLVGVETLNRPGEPVLARRLIEAGLTPLPDRIADPAFTPKDFATQRDASLQHASLREFWRRSAKSTVVRR